MMPASFIRHVASAGGSGPSAGTVLANASSSGSYTNTYGVEISVVIEGWGGGGGGRVVVPEEGEPLVAASASGAYVKKNTYALAAGATISFTVGAAGLTGEGIGGAGGNTSITASGLSLTANGGYVLGGGTASGGDVNTTGNAASGGLGAGAPNGGGNSSGAGTSPGGGGAYPFNGAAGAVKIVAA